MIRGEDVILLTEEQTGTDMFDQPIYSTTEITVKNVLVGTPSTDDVASELDVSGKVLQFVLGIPKGDTNDWKDKTVVIRGQKFKTYGFPLTQLECNVPGRWNTQVKVEAYE